MPLDTVAPGDIHVVKLRSGGMVPVDNDPYYNRLVIPPQLAPRFVAEPLMRLAKWRKNQLRWDDPGLRPILEAINALQLPWRLERALQNDSAPVAQITAKPKEREHLTIEVGLDLQTGFCLVETLQPRAKVTEVITMCRNDRRIQSRVSGGH